MTVALKRWLKAISFAVLLGLFIFGEACLEPAYAAIASTDQTLLISRLPSGNPITDGRALLRYALPIDNKPVRELQLALEEISTPLRISSKRLNALNPSLSKAEKVLSKPQAILESVPADRQAQAEALLAQIQQGIQDIRGKVEAKEREPIWALRAAILDEIGQVEELMVKEFPYSVPEEYSSLPQLKGRSTIVVKTNKGDITLVVDGYSAPVTAGNFVDLVKRGFYDGLEFTRAEESYVLQIGDPPGPEVGFIDPKTKAYRAIPLEILVTGDDAPTYGITLEEAGRYLEQPVLPFSAYGAVAMARPGDDPNGASSQFFFFLFEPELTPAGFNLLDGRYSVFGYVIEGKEVLGKLRQGDRIESAKVIDGLDNLVEPV